MKQHWAQTYHCTGTGYGHLPKKPQTEFLSFRTDLYELSRPDICLGSNKSDAILFMFRSPISWAYMAVPRLLLLFRKRNDFRKKRLT